MSPDSRVPENSRAILIGVSSYQDTAVYPSYPAVANSLHGMFEVLTDPGLCGWPVDRVELILNPTNAGQLITRLRDLARQTTGVLLFYFVGHGVLTEDSELCLAISDTDGNNPDATGVEYGKIKNMLHRVSPAATRIAILDSCFSGRIIGLAATNTPLADLSEVAGTYTLTAADNIAHVVTLDQQANAYTSFTGELLELIRSGIPGGPRELTLYELYPRLRHRLLSKNLPRPNQRGTDNANQFIFTRNAIASNADELPRIAYNFSEGGSLVDALKDSGAHAKESVTTSIVALAQVAEQLGLRETATRILAIETRLRSDTFNLILLGRFKTGKSTLLNALLNAPIGGAMKEMALDDYRGPMVVNDLPATATLTGVSYADEPYVIAYRFDGTTERWSWPRYLQESTLDIDEQENAKRFSTIREFEVGFPAKLCQAGVTIYDSPGLDEHESRTLVTRDATRRCDAAIVVYRSDALMGRTEMMDATRLVADGTRIFTVVNMWSNREVDDRLRGFVWNKYVRDHLSGPRWDHQDLASRDIYFVNAALACDARYGGAEGFTRSGLAVLEQRLGEFLVRDRQHVHLLKFTTQALNLVDTIDEHIAQRRIDAKANKHDRSDRERMLTLLANAGSVVANHRLALQRALILTAE